MIYALQKVYLTSPNNKFVRFVDACSIDNFTSCLPAGLLVGDHQDCSKTTRPEDPSGQLPLSTTKVFLHISKNVHGDCKVERLSKCELAHSQDLDLVTMVEQNTVVFAHFAAETDITRIRPDECAVCRTVSKEVQSIVLLTDVDLVQIESHRLV